MGREYSLERVAALREALDLFSEEDVAEAFGLKAETLAAWRSAEKGPDYAKLGKSIFYRRKDVLEWINMNIVLTKRA